MNRSKRMQRAGALAGLALFSFLAGPARPGTRMMTHEPSYITGRWANFSSSDVQGTGDGQMRHQLSARFNAIDNSLFPLNTAFTVAGELDIDAPSSPIREERFMPEVFLAWQDLWEFDEVRAGWLHESNGQDSTQSRGWDRAYVAADFSLFLGELRGVEFVLSGTGKLWWVISASSDNPLIGTTDVTGLLRDDLGGELTAQLSADEAFILELGVGAKRGRVTAYWNPNPEWRGYYFMAEIFRGLGDTLARYDEYATAGQVGLAFLPWETEE